jgi:hypothetical protein
MFAHTPKISSFLSRGTRISQTNCFFGILLAFWRYTLRPDICTFPFSHDRPRHERKLETFYSLVVGVVVPEAFGERIRDDLQLRDLQREMNDNRYGTIFSPQSSRLQRTINNF